MEKSKKFIALCKKYGVNPERFETEITSFEDACKITGDDSNALPIVDGIADKHKNRIISDYKLSVIAQAIRNNKEVDYTDSSAKYFPVFEVKATKKQKSGSGLAFNGYVLWSSLSYVGVRLCLFNADQAIFFSKHFLALHTQHHLYL